MLKQIRRFAFTAVALAVLAGSAFGLEKVPYSQERFAEAQNAGKPILVDVYASWCSTCQAQAPVLEKLAAKQAYRGLTVFEVDFDRQKDAVKTFRAGAQSTLIAFRGGKETGRSAGETSEAALEMLISSAF
jgi:thiol-disulfide isomerase/thioredoxin